MSLRSPLGRVLGLGSAKGGSAHWYSQRVTSVALVVLCLWFVASLVLIGDARHEAVVTWLHAPFPAVMAMLLVVVTAYHAHLGLQVVFEDYVADKGTRLVILVVIKFALVTATLIGVLAVLRIAAGVGA